MFKKLVRRISEIKSKAEFDEACSEVDNAFQHEKITWSDHEILFEILGKISV